MPSHIKSRRPGGLPGDLRRELIEARHRRDWSQAELGRLVGLPQTHISGIETGKVAPRFDTLLELVRVLDHDLVLAPRALVPAFLATIRNYRRSDRDPEAGERSLYADGNDAEER